MPVGMIFLVASHLTNIHSCIYGSQVWKDPIFQCPPPKKTTTKNTSACLNDQESFIFQVADFFGIPTPVLTKYLGYDD